MKLGLGALFIICSILSVGQSLIQSGPMNGYSEMREAMVWVQTTEPGIVELVYWPDSLPQKEYHSTPMVAEASSAFAVHLLADSVEPGVRYGYDIYINGQNQTDGRSFYFKTQPLWRWRNDPPDFAIALGSCAYINEPKYDRLGKPYGSHYGIFDAIAAKRPDMMLWLGDNIYLREADWFTRTGILKRYSHTRSTPELQNLLVATQHYAIWDDHDFGPNDANRSFPHKNITLEAFKLFWANNGYGVNGLGGITSAFQFHDMHFYLLDNRWNRTDPNLKTIDEQVIGAEQLDWLIESLKYSQAEFKFVAIGGQVLNDAKVYETYANYEAEREQLLERIGKEKIQNVIFLTGDRHHTELSKVEVNGSTIYDLTVSPLTSGTHQPGEVNSNRVEGTLVNGHNFGILNISGPEGKRVMTIAVYDSNGEQIWERNIASTH